MELRDVLFEVKDGIGVITLNRPEVLNAVSTAMSEGLNAVLREVRGNREVRVLILTGAGRGFCAGGDVGSFARNLEAQAQPEPPKRPWRRPGGGVSYITGFRDAEQPIIGAINGPAAGLGFSIAMATDIRIAAESAFFTGAWIRRGLMPDGGGNYLLPRLVGLSRAFELLWTGDRISAQEAERIGLVSQVVPSEQLMPAAMELARRLAKMPPIPMALAKRAVYMGETGTLEQVLEFESYGQDICFKTEDHAEGVRAFFEKREGVFVGR